MSDIKEMVKIAYDALTDKKAINPKIIDCLILMILLCIFSIMKIDYFMIWKESGGMEKVLKLRIFKMQNIEIEYCGYKSFY